MGIIIQTCPHCRAGDATFSVIGAKLQPRIGDNTVGHHLIAVAAVCPRCSMPVAAVLINMTKHPHSEVASRLARFLSEPHGPEVCGLTVKKVWPQPEAPTAPAHIPPSVERAVLQAERNYPTEGNEEASAMMYRRALELSLKEKYPTLKGTLAARITELVEKNMLPAALGEWADEIRLLGNDAAHELGEVNRDQLTLIRGFTDATLKYLYTLPYQIAMRRFQ